MEPFHEQRLYDTDLPVYAQKVEDNNYLAHWHRDGELAYVLSGKIRLGADRESRVLEAGGLALFPSDRIHHYDSGSLSSEIIIIVFKPSAIGPDHGWPGKGILNQSLFSREELDSFRTGLSGQLRDLFMKIWEEQENGEKGTDLIIKASLLELTGLFYRYLPDGEIPGKGMSKGVRHIRKALDYLETHFDQSVNLDSMARSLELSPCHLSRLFQRYTGMGYREYLNRIRVEKARERLSSCEDSLTSILYDCGFSSVRTFNRVYKNLRGEAPSLSRKKLT